LRSWEDRILRVHDHVRDNKGEFGRGVILKLEPYGADIEWQRGGRGFLGFAWLDKIPSLAQRVAHPTVEKIIEVPDVK